MSNPGSSHPQDQPPQEWQPGQQPYGPSAYAAGRSDQVRFHPGGPTIEHPQATLAFVLGLLSVLGLAILGPFGWYVGNKVVAEIDRDPLRYNNRGIGMAGKVLGIIGTVFLGLVVIGVVGLIAFAIFAASASRGR